MSRNVCSDQEAVAFVIAHRSDCMLIAAMLKLPTEYILGLAAHESQYGKGRIAREYNNFFSLHAPALFQTGAIAPRGNAKIKVAIFPSFLESARSFEAKFGPPLKGLSDPAAFAKELVRHGFNSGSAADGGTSGYEKLLIDVIGKVKARMACIT